MQTRSERQAQNFKGGVYAITKWSTDKSNKAPTVEIEQIKGKKNALHRRDQLQNIAYKEARAAGLTKATEYWAVNINTGTIVY